MARVRENSQKRKLEKRREEDQRRESQEKGDAGARNGSKVAKPWVFPMICGSGGSQSRSGGCGAIWPGRCGVNHISKSR